MILVFYLNVFHEKCEINVRYPMSLMSASFAYKVHISNKTMSELQNLHQMHKTWNGALSLNYFDFSWTWDIVSNLNWSEDFLEVFNCKHNSAPIQFPWIYSVHLIPICLLVTFADFFKGIIEQQVQLLKTRNSFFSVTTKESACRQTTRMKWEKTIWQRQFFILRILILKTLESQIRRGASK